MLRISLLRLFFAGIFVVLGIALIAVARDFAIRLSGPLAFLLAYGIIRDVRRLKVPVLMYHSVSDQRENLPWGELVCSVEGFFDQMRYLKSRGFESITLYDLHDHITGRRTLPPKPVVITSALAASASANQASVRPAVR